MNKEIEEQVRHTRNILRESIQYNLEVNIALIAKLDSILSLIEKEPE